MIGTFRKTQKQIALTSLLLTQDRACAEQPTKPSLISALWNERGSYGLNWISPAEEIQPYLYDLLLSTLCGGALRIAVLRIGVVGISTPALGP